MVVFNLQYNTTKVDNVSPFISNWLACFFTAGHWVFFPVHNIIISTSFHMFGISHFLRYAVFFHIFIFYATLKVHLCKKQILWQSFLNDFYHLKRIIPKLWYIYREYCHLKKEVFDGIARYAHFLKNLEKRTTKWQILMCLRRIVGG